MSHVILSPLGLGLLLLLLGGALRRWMGPRTAWLTLPPLWLCLVLMTPLGANFLVHQLEGNDLRPGACTQEATRPLVLLTGGLDQAALTESDFAALTPSSTRRVFALFASGLVTHDRPLLIAGGAEQGIPESRVVRQLALRLGALPGQIQLEEQSTSTWGNATEVAKLLRTQSPRITLVTSALHMKRAVLAFERQGLDVCPLPVDSDYIAPSGWGYVLPQSSALRKSERAIHEWIGWAAYRVRQAPSATVTR